MTTEPIDACAAAIAEVRERYFIGYKYDLSQPREVFDHHADCHEVPVALFTGTETECQAWIDREAARACLEAIRTPTREMYAAMGDAIVKGGLSTVYHHDHVADVIWSAGITTAITKQEEG